MRHDSKDKWESGISETGKRANPINLSAKEEVPDWPIGAQLPWWAFEKQNVENTVSSAIIGHMCF